MIYLRRLKRLSSFEDGDLENVGKIEFRNSDGQPDLALSVYEVDDEYAVVVRVGSEHSASFLQPPVKRHENVNLAGLFEFIVDATPGKTRFEFTKKCHRELRLPDVSTLQMVIAAIAAQLEDLKRIAKPIDVHQYIKNRVIENDPEWTTFCEAMPKWATVVCK